MFYEVENIFNVFVRFLEDTMSFVRMLNVQQKLFANKTLQGTIKRPLLQVSGLLSLCLPSQPTHEHTEVCRLKFETFGRLYIIVCCKLSSTLLKSLFTIS